MTPLGISSTSTSSITGLTDDVITSPDEVSRQVMEFLVKQALEKGLQGFPSPTDDNPLSAGWNDDEDEEELRIEEEQEEEQRQEDEERALATSKANAAG